MDHESRGSAAGQLLLERHPSCVCVCSLRGGGRGGGERGRVALLTIRLAPIWMGPLLGEATLCCPGSYDPPFAALVSRLHCGRSGGRLRTWRRCVPRVRAQTLPSSVSFQPSVEFRVNIKSVCINHFCLPAILLVAHTTLCAPNRHHGRSLAQRYCCKSPWPI